MNVLSACDYPQGFHSQCSFSRHTFRSSGEDKVGGEGSFVLNVRVPCRTESVVQAHTIRIEAIRLDG
jgi:hypothetical protein